MFGDGGSAIYTPGLMMERFQLAADETFFGNRHIKTMAKTASIIAPHIHTHQLREDAVLTNASGRQLESFPAASQVVDFTVAQINHYFTKTRPEWEKKRARGKADARQDNPNRFRNDSEFDVYNRNDCLDTSILPRSEKTSSLISAIFD
jgi:hypothetical protein